jgi:hypothetical protein
MISLIPFDLQGNQRGLVELQQIAPEIQQQFQPPADQFPKRINREFNSKNREHHFSIREDNAAQGEVSLGKSKDAFLDVPLHWKLHADQRFERELRRLDSVQNVGLDF